MSNRNLIYGMIILAVLCFSVMLGGCKNNKAESAAPSEQESSSAVSSEESKAESEDERPIPTGADENEIFLFGDATDDFSVDANDALLILRASVGVANVDENVFPLADIDKDEALTANDALEVLRYSVDLSDNDRIGNPYVPNTDMKVYIEPWDVTIPDDFDGYVLTFDSNGGSERRTQLLEKGDTAQKPLDPEKDGYAFDGWYKDENDIDPFDFGTEITEDTTLHAHWADLNFYLQASDRSVIVPASGEGGRIRLTLATLENAPNGIEVKYGTKDNLDKSVTLLDNALAENGDDIKGDGVYSGYVTLYEGDKFIYFVADFGSLRSNYAKVQAIAGLAEGEKNSVDIVNDELTDYSKTEEFLNMSLEKRKEVLVGRFEEYCNKDYIKYYSINEDRLMFSYETKTGALGMFYYGDPGTLFSSARSYGEENPVFVVNNALTDYSETEEYHAMAEEERKEGLLSIVSSFYDQGIVTNYSVDEQERLIVYRVYTNGVGNFYYGKKSFFAGTINPNEYTSS